MKRIVLWTIGVLAALVVAITLAFALSPWPTVAVIQYVFARGDAASEAALEKHVPPDIESTLDLAYGPGEAEAFDLFRATGASGQPVIVWVHGGAWVAGSKAGVRNYLRVLAGQGYTTISVEYSTGYGTTYPEPVRQVNAALGHIVANAGQLGIDAGRLVLAGDSAGAQIAAQMAMIATDADYAARVGIVPAVPADTIKGLLLVSGAFDIEGIDLDGSMGWFLRAVLWAYSGVKDFMADESLKLASVVQHVSGTFPPAFVTSGNGDPLESQAVSLVARLETLGMEVDSLFFPADTAPPLPHEYQFNLDRPEGQLALERIVAFLRRTVP